MNLGTVKPTFLIIGAQKGGTTSLHEYLVQHPEILGSTTKELHFFDKEEEIIISEYHKHFPRKYFTNYISFESTPRYLYYPNVAEKLYRYNSNFKLIILLRDPAKRAYSAWNMYMQMKNSKVVMKMFKEEEDKNSNFKLYSFINDNKNSKFEHWIEQEIKFSNLLEPSILKRGYYVNQIEEYLKYFNQNQLLILSSKELKINLTQSLDKIFQFLDVKKIDTTNLDLSLKHSRKYEQEMSSETYSFLKTHFKEMNKNLYKYVDFNEDWF
ncbi:Sulfotransferase domain-containing protein [Mesonia phycicola]|uniref:Sulfotransferase domain-containing protein n=1 Tax=Mesonia phycicola TaxID=579105 RepID=A0A1M6AND5_9FLAO|nr:sulfotransferase domain-containing protein [Mesonia phycicola]SHI37907.1 Sulfotransferase domain-containing protein [Mesonia phycicola]